MNDTAERGDELWTTQDIADYMKIHRSTVYATIVCREDFPKAIRIPSNKTGRPGAPRWYASEVKRWVRQFREAA